jgi:hypothetical protein
VRRSNESDSTLAEVGADCFVGPLHQQAAAQDSQGYSQGDALAPSPVENRWQVGRDIAGMDLHILHSRLFIHHCPHYRVNTSLTRKLSAGKSKSFSRAQR